MFTTLSMKKTPKTCNALAPVYRKKDFVNKGLENKVQLLDIGQ